MDGWVKLHRKILQSDMYRSLNSKQRDVLITLLLMANHKENKWEYKGEIYTVKPGQFVTSLEGIKENCAKDVSIQNIRTALLKLEKWGFLTNKSTKTGRLITIVNWELYQGSEVENQQRDQQTTNKELTTNKNEKNDIDKTTSPDGPDDPDSLNNKQLIIELVSMYRQIEKITPKKGDYSFIGKLYNDYGYDIVYSAIQRLARKLAKDNVRDSLLYLKSICQKLDEEARRPNMGVVIPYRPDPRSEPIRVNMPTPEDLERQRQVEEEMWRIREEKRRKREQQNGGMVNGA